MRRPRPAGSESKRSKAVSPCGSTCTSRAAQVVSRAATERRRPPVTKRRTCRTLEGGSEALDYLAIDDARDSGFGGHAPEVFGLQHPCAETRVFP